MNEKQIAEILKPVLDKFVAKLEGRFKHHVSDEFIKAYITKEFILQYKKQSNDSATNIAYAASVSLFQNLLEYHCKCDCVGHHVAQSFCSYFEDEPISVAGVKSAAID